MRLSAVQEAQNLYKKLQAGVGNVANFVKQNPTPAGYVNQQFQQRVSQPIARSVVGAVNTSIPGGIQGGVNRVKQSFQNPSQYNFYQQAAQGNVPSFTPFNQAGQFVGNYVQNRYIQPVLDIPKNTKTLVSKNNTLLNRGAAGLGVLGGFASFFPDPVQDAIMPLADLAKGYRASAIRGGNFKQNVKSGFQAMSLEKPVGLGTAVTTDPTGELAGNIAELPLAIGMTGKMNKKQTLGFDKKTIDLARQGFTPEVKNLIKDFAVAVETSSSPNKKNLGQLGDYIHSLAATLWGEKNVANMTNTQLKNALDIVLQQVENRAPMGRFYPVGMTARSLRGGEVNVSSSSKTKGTSKPGGTQTTTLQTQLATAPQLESGSNTTANRLANGNRPKGTPLAPIIPEASKETNDYLSSLIKGQRDAKNAGTKVGTLKRIYGEIKRKFVDSASPIEDVLSEAEKKGKFQVRPEGDVRIQIDRVLRSPTLAGQFAKDNGLTDVIRNVDNLDALDQYMIAKHARTIESTGRKTGRDLAKDEQLIRELGPKYEEVSKQVTAYSRKLLDYSVESGLISKDLADKLKTQYPDYVPLNRIFDEAGNVTQGTGRGVASVSRQSVVQKLVGSEREIESPIASLLAKTNDAFAQGERNVAARQLASYKDLPGFEGLIKELDGNSTGKHTFSFIDNGKKRTFETTPELAAAAKSLNREQLGFVGKLLSIPTRVLRLGATGLNIPFVGANIVKDQLTGFVNSNKAAKTSLLNPGNFLRALWSAGKHDELYDEVIRAGAGGTSFDIGRQNVPATIEKIRSGRSLAGKIGYTVKHPQELVTAIENLIGRSEELARIQQFKGTKDALLKEGRTAKDATLLAANAARNNTANFARSGDYGKVLNLIIPYFNAGIQGSRATIQALQRDPVGTGAKIAVGLFTPVAAATMWNLSDPERKKVYEDIDDFEKENNIILILDPKQGLNKGRYRGVVKIPLQQGFGALSTGVRKGIEQAYGLAPAKMSEIAAGLIQFGTSLNVGSPRELVSSFTPQALKVPIEASTNTNMFTGKQIVPQYMKSKPADEQVFDFTSGTARKIGGLLNVSPLHVQNAIQTSMGGVGRQLLNASDVALNKMGVIPKEQIGGESVGEATSKRFTSASGGKKLDEAYKAKEIKDNAKREALQIYLSGDKQKALELKKQHGFTITKEDIKRTQTTQLKKAADLYVEGKVDQAKEIKSKYGFKITQSDVQKSAKRKAIELYKLGLKDEARELKTKYGFTVSRKDLE